MDQQVTILYIDQDYQISHWTLREKTKPSPGFRCPRPLNC